MKLMASWVSLHNNNLKRASYISKPLDTEFTVRLAGRYWSIGFCRVDKGSGPGVHLFAVCRPGPRQAAVVTGPVNLAKGLNKWLQQRNSCTFCSRYLQTCACANETKRESGRGTKRTQCVESRDV